MSIESELKLKYVATNSFTEGKRKNDQERPKNNRLLAASLLIDTTYTGCYKKVQLTHFHIVVHIIWSKPI